MVVWLAVQALRRADAIAQLGVVLVGGAAVAYYLGYDPLAMAAGVVAGIVTWVWETLANHAVPF